MEQFLKRHHLLLILFCYFTTTFSLSGQIHWLIFLLALLCIGWRLGIYFGRLAAPSVMVNRLAAILGAALLTSVVFSQGLFSAMMHLIVLGYTLKFLELSARRDINVFICTGLVLVAVFYVFETSMLMALWGIVLALFHLALAISFYGSNLSHKSQIKFLGRLVLVSLPLALMLFLLLPRLPPMWKLPLQNQATTGLSDTVNPGDIAELSRSSELAFRVSFEGEVPSPSERYWRVMTLDHYQGGQWSQSESIKNAINVAQRGGQFNIEFKGVAESYELILEPSFQTWVPSLAVSRGRANRANLMANYTLRNDIPVSQRMMLRLQQFADTQMQYLDLTMERQSLMLPDSGNEQTRAWVSQLAAQSSSPQQKINQVLQRFSGESFRYTLKPPPLGAQQMDDFLFNTQAGFCVHYAGSFVYIMRLLGLPARMVTGYQGGEWDPQGGFLTVRQYDAHAWAEVYLDGQWQRFDPTAFVAPERVEQGLELALPNEFLADDTLSMLKLRSNPMLNQLYLAMAQFDYLWAVWVLNYDNQKQFELIKRWFGELDFFGQIWLFIGLFVGIIGLMLLWNLKPWQKAKLSIEDKLLARLQKRFKVSVGDRQQGETVTDYCARLSEHSDFKGEQGQSKRDGLLRFAQIYNALKYAPLSEQQRVDNLAKLRLLLRGL